MKWNFEWNWSTLTFFLIFHIEFSCRYFNIINTVIVVPNTNTSTNNFQYLPEIYAAPQNFPKINSNNNNNRYHEKSGNCLQDLYVFTHSRRQHTMENRTKKNTKKVYRTQVSSVTILGAPHSFLFRLICSILFLSITSFFSLQSFLHWTTTKYEHINHINANTHTHGFRCCANPLCVGFLCFNFTAYDCCYWLRWTLFRFILTLVDYLVQKIW